MQRAKLVINSFNKKIIIGVDRDNEIKENWNADFIANLSAANSNEETKQILSNDLTKKFMQKLRILICTLHAGAVENKLF